LKRAFHVFSLYRSGTSRGTGTDNSAGAVPVAAFTLKDRSISRLECSSQMRRKAMHEK
jgi:hypothetical protein